MAAPTDHPQNPAEHLISVTIQATWALWLVGGLYIAGPLLGWTLGFMAARALYLAPARAGAQGTGAQDRPGRPGPAVIVWLAGMTAMLVILLIGHATNELDAAQTLKSAMGWAKGWALLALFPFAAAVLDIRIAVIARAVCRLGIQTLVVLPLFLAAPWLGLPGQLYVSPLVIFGGSGPEYFAVILYTIEPGTGALRWQFFAPWSPAAGMVAVVSMLLAIEERRPGLRLAGVLAALALALFSSSRLALIAVAVVWPLAHAVARIGRPAFWFIAAPLMLAAGLFSSSLLDAVDRAMTGFAGARADSSRVRATLGRIALERWQDEAPWFGHGIVERGPHIVEYMPIGSHHSWYGLLFVKGALGALALAVPMLVGLWQTGTAAGRQTGTAAGRQTDTAAGRQTGISAGHRGTAGEMPERSAAGRLGFAMMATLFLYSFGENLEVLGYLVWPGLLAIGCAERVREPLRRSAPAAPQPPITAVAA